MSARQSDGSARPGIPGPLPVLVAEDDATHRARLHAMLEGTDYAVTCASSGEQAIAAYVRASVPVALIDTDLAGLDGVEVCRRIRALDPGHRTSVLVFSRSDDFPRLLEAMDAGADDYCAEVSTAEHLHARLQIAQRRLVLEEARRRAEADAARARYLAGVGEMAIALQHEINNPLAAILAHAELLAMDGPPGVESNESLQTILEQARRIADVVRRLSSLRNPTSVEYVPGKRMVHLKDE